jgi:hypothetical protein
MIPPRAGWFERLCAVKQVNNELVEVEERDDRTWALAITAVMQNTQPKMGDVVTDWAWAPEHEKDRLKREWEAWSAKTGEPLPWAPSAKHRGPFTKPERPEYWQAAALAHIERHYGSVRA